MHSVTREDVAAFPSKIIVYLLFLAGMERRCLWPRCPGQRSPRTAIMLFDGPNGPSYIRLPVSHEREGGAACFVTVATRIDKRSYDLMSRAQLRVGISLERNLMAC